MTALRAALGALLVAFLCAGLVAGTGLPYQAEVGDHALVRLSWRAVGERVEACRRPSEEELAALPPHMRRAEICEGRMTPFRLAVAIDGEELLDERILPSGTRQDRPVYVLREFPVAQGPHRLRVAFAEELPEGAGRAPRPPLVLDEAVAAGAPLQVEMPRDRHEALALQVGERLYLRPRQVRVFLDA